LRNSDWLPAAGPGKTQKRIESASHLTGGFFVLEENVTKEEVQAAILATKKMLGHVPSRAELLKHKGVSRRDLRKNFGTYQCALEACGLEKTGGGKKVRMAQLFEDWTGIVRTLKKVPTVTEYEQRSQYSVRPLLRCFGAWVNIPDGMRLYVEENGLAEEYKDVLEAIARRAKSQSDVPRPSAPTSTPKVMTDRPVYGPLITGWPLVFAPTNEAGVLFLFGAMAASLGFLALRIQTEYPDCEGMRVVGEDQLQRVKIELEHQSRNFLKHLHDPSKCDLIVCWEHNWPECPLEVIELKSHLPRLPELPKSPKLEKQDLTTDEHG
jgi:HNH endonuclease